MTITEFRETFPRYSEQIQLDFLASLAVQNVMEELGKAAEAYITLSQFPSIGVKEQFELAARAQEKLNEAAPLQDKYDELHGRAEAAAQMLGLQVPALLIKTEDGSFQDIRDFVNLGEYAAQMAAKYAR